MTEIMIIRHGQSVADIEGRYEGNADFPLTETGRMQAGRLADWLLDHWRPEALFCSTLSRTRETADIVAGRLALGVQFDDDLRERHIGAVAGMLRSEANDRYPVPAKGLKRHESLNGGEPELEFRMRAERFMSKLFAYIEENPEICRIGVVTHGGMIQMLFRAYLQLPIESSIFIPTGDTGFHLWGWKNGSQSILKTNVLEHLKAE